VYKGASVLFRNTVPPPMESQVGQPLHFSLLPKKTFWTTPIISQNAWTSAFQKLLPIGRTLSPQCGTRQRRVLSPTPFLPQPPSFFPQLPNPGITNPMILSDVVFDSLSSHVPRFIQLIAFGSLFAFSGHNVLLGSSGWLRRFAWKLEGNCHSRPLFPLYAVQKGFFLLF